MIRRRSAKASRRIMEISSRGQITISCCIGRRAVRIVYFDQRNELIETHIEDRPASEVIGELGLRRPIYADLCRSGLFSAIERGDYGYGEK